jgi:hypothetical protein
VSYCTLSDVRSLNPTREYSPTSTPSEEQVEALITQIAAEIDAVLQAQGYTVPVTTPANFVIALKAINAYGAAALAEMGMFPETSEMGSTPHWKTLNEKYENWMKALRNGEIPPELSAGTAGEMVGGYYTDAADQSEFPDPAFRKKDTDLQF